MKIHGHPQLTEWSDDPTAWITYSGQGHWRPGSGMPQTFPVIPVGLSTADPQIAHTHIDLRYVPYSEITGPVTIQGTLKLFHTAGHVESVYSPLNQISHLVWADTGTSTPPALVGDPMGLKQWNFSFVIDPTLLSSIFNADGSQSPAIPRHGWFQLQVSAKTVYDNGDQNTPTHLVYFYAMLDPTQPETPWRGNGPTIGASCAPNHLRPELGPYGNQMGELFSTFVGMIPLAPISAPYALDGFFYAYASLEGSTIPNFQFPDGTFSLRRDVDIHNGKPGVDIVPPLHFQGNGQFQPTPIVLDPAVIGEGAHNIVAFWQEPDGTGHDATALFVFPLTVGAGGPPPPQPTTIAAPDVVGLTQMAADMALMGAGLQLGTVTPQSDPTASGNIISQSPSAQSVVAVGSSVNLTVSTGPAVPPTSGDVWVVMKTPPIFMQLVTNGVPTDRFKICDPNEPMKDASNCPEIVTK
jgi:PASTA domain